MSWLPQSLLSRSVLLIATLLMISQLIWLGLFRSYSSRTESEHLANEIAGVIGTISVALDTMPASSQRRFFENLASRENIRLLPADEWDDQDMVLPQSPLLKAIGEHLKRNKIGGTKAEVLLEDATQALWIKISVNDESYWVVFPSDLGGSASVWAWTGWSVFGLSLAIIGAYLLMLRVNRPLHALADAAEDIGAGKKPTPLDEKGPIEIRMLSRAFNRMSDNLQQLDQDRALLLAGISHDLRTPLSRLRLGVEMLNDGDDDSLRDGMVQDIHDMDGIINQFLEFARQGANEPSSAREDLNQIVSDVVDRYDRLGVPISRSLGKLPLLTLKPIATQRMITNLIDNAVRHGGREVEVYTALEGDRAVIRVLDRGPGIPAEHAIRVMQPFTRLEASRADGRGSGLGLAIVERSAHLHGGSVSLLTREGGGLEARVELPLSRGD